MHLEATDGFVRRDKLLGLFWPESDTDKARASLRRSLSYLRSSLGDGVVETRGDEEVGVTAAALECDAIRFQSAMGRSDFEAASELYGGTLLDGLFVSNAPSLTTWLEDERARLKLMAVEAAAALADEYEKRGDPQTALAWARKALGLEPHNEPGVCRLIALLERAGDREGAVHTYDEFALRLATELDLEPSAEARDLIQAIRTTPLAESTGKRNRRAAAAGFSRRA